jgi:hypothetical protein
MYVSAFSALYMYIATKNPMKKTQRRSGAKVRRLRFYGPDGKPYQRPETVENDIAEMLSVHHSQRAGRAPFALNESLIYCIRRRDNNDEQYHEVFVGEIDKRLADHAGRYVRKLPQVQAEDIVTKVQHEFRELIFAERGSARTEFLEVAFALAVKKRTLQLVNLYWSSPWSRRSNAAALDDDEEITEQELQRIHDRSPDPEAALLDKENQALCKQLCERALDAITDPLDREIATLHWLDGWPIASKIRGEPDLVGKYRTSRGKIEWRLERGKRQMRAAVGVAVTK